MKSNTFAVHAYEYVLLFLHIFSDGKLNFVQSDEFTGFQNYQMNLCPVIIVFSLLKLNKPVGYAQLIYSNTQ